MPKKSELLPTPPVGYRVLWRECGGRNVKPADVVDELPGEPGVVALSINLGARLMLMEAVHWENHPGAQNVLSKNIQFRGTWAYMPGETVPDAHLQSHKDLLVQREENVKQQEEWLKEQARLSEEMKNQPVDPRHVAVARAQAAAILQGAQ